VHLCICASVHLCVCAFVRLCIRTSVEGLRVGGALEDSTGEEGRGGWGGPASRSVMRLCAAEMPDGVGRVGS
jgi:hypothetical protein